MLKIEIFPENANINSRTIPGKDGKAPRIIHEQIAYAYLGGKFPVEMKLSLEDSQNPYVVGVYSLDSSSFIVNNFGSLELKRFGIKIKPLDNE